MMPCCSSNFLRCTSSSSKEAFTLAANSFWNFCSSSPRLTTLRPACHQHVFFWLHECTSIQPQSLHCGLGGCIPQLRLGDLCQSTWPDIRDSMGKELCYNTLDQLCLASQGRLVRSEIMQVRKQSSKKQLGPSRRYTPKLSKQWADSTSHTQNQFHTTFCTTFKMFI